jgi:hypothetical protein
MRRPEWQACVAPDFEAIVILSPLFTGHFVEVSVEVEPGVFFFGKAKIAFLHGLLEFILYSFHGMLGLLIRSPSFSSQMARGGARSAIAPSEKKISGVSVIFTEIFDK